MQVGKLQEEARQLELSAITISKCLRYGMFASLFVGQGIDFDSCREYSFNDDIRYIDWNLTARTGKPFVKLYNEEHDTAVFVLVDASASMRASAIGTKAISYFEKAGELAALFLFAGYHLSSQIGGLIFSDKVERLWPTKQSSAPVFSIVHTLKNFSIRDSATSNLDSALKVTNKILTKHSLAVIISDFKINGYEKRLSILSKNHDVLAIKIISPNDYALPNAGLLNLYDSENDAYIFINTASKKQNQNYKKDFEQELERYKNSCFDAGALPCTISIDDNSVKVLATFLMSAKNKHEAQIIAGK